MKKRRLLAMFLAVTMLVGLWTLTSKPETSEAAAAETRQEVMPLSSNPGTWFWDFGTDEVAFKVTAASAFDGTYLYLANSGQNSVLNVKVYAWKTDYATTKAGTAVVNQNVDVAAWRGDDYNSRASTGTEIKFGKAVRSGTYLVAYSVVSGSITHSINVLSSRASGVEFYRNGGSPRSEWDTIVGGLLYAPDRQEVMPLALNSGTMFWEFGTDEVAFKVTAASAFDGAYIYLGNSGQNSVLNVKVYAWKTDYAMTKAGTAVVNQNVDIAAWRGDDYNSRAATGTEIKFGKAVRSGTYLVAYSVVSGSITHSINMLASRASGVEFYRNGGSPRSEWDTIVGGILCTDEPAETTVLWGEIGGGNAYFLYGNDASSPRSVGVRFHALNQFEKIQLGVNAADKLTYLLYRWCDDYDATISGTPVRTVTDANTLGSAIATVDFGEAAPEGEYLLLVKPASETPSGWISVWTKASSMPESVDYYCDGARQLDETTETAGIAECALYRCMAGGIVYVDDTVNTFGTLSARTPADVNPDPSSWVATDGLGRTLDSYGAIPEARAEKYVGMFYFDTTGYWSSLTVPRNIQQLLDSVGEATAAAAKNDYSHAIWQSADAVTWFWDEPLFGYYSSNDAYVIRKHAELLADADIDVIFIDFTHTDPANHSFMKIFEGFQEARLDGVDAPAIAFMLPMGDANACANRLRYLYENLYSKNLYQDLWFYYEGKPLILAYNDYLQSTGTDLAIRNFFTYRRADAYSWRTEDFVSTPSLPYWGWLSTYPQTKYYNDKVGKKVEQITVSVAQNVDVVEQASTAMNGTNVAGRSYTAGNYSYSYTKDGAVVNVTSDMEDSVLYGLNFQQQWDYAIEADPTFIFVTGWNEWTVGRYATFEGVSNGFPDQYNAEYSRDIEPSAGILKDHYYYQLVANVRRFKGAAAQDTIVANTPIDINGDLSQWEDVTSFDHYVGSTRNRTENGFLGYEYDSATMRNDIVRTKVAYDSSNVYFYVETRYDLTPETDPAWMRLFLDTSFSGEAPNWEGFEYVVNRVNPENGLCKVERSCGTTANGLWAWEEVGEAAYTVSGSVLQIAIPRTMLGLTAEEMVFNFKWSDNMQTEGDILDFYRSGDAAPGGRFMFRFRTADEKKEFMPLATNPSNMFWPFNSDVIGVRAKAEAEFDGVYLYLANAGAASVLNCKVYAWNTDYATTVAGAALVDQDTAIAAWRGDDYNTRADTGTEIMFDTVLPKGEYLITYSMTSGSLTHSINLLSNAASGVQFYRNGGSPRSEWDTITGGLLYRKDAAFTMASVTLYEDITIDFGAKLPTLLTKQELTASVVFRGDELPAAVTKDGNNVNVSFTDILPQDISETLCVRLFANGVLIAEKPDYSIQTYCERIMPAADDADNVELRSLLIALLNYGTESQKYFEDRTGNFANAGLSAAEIASVNQDMSEAQTVKAVSTKTDADNYWKSATVGLFNVVKIRLKFYASDVSKITVRIGSSVLDTFETDGNGIYFVDYDQFTANEFDSALEAQLCVNGTPVQTATYSVNSYVNSYVKSGKGSTDETYGLIQAIYDYGCAAKAFVS